MSSLAEQLDLEPSTLTPLLKRLEGAGLVERTRNPKDERQVLIELTNQGQELRSRAGCVAQTMVDQSDMTMTELKALNELIRGLLSRMRDEAAVRSVRGFDARDPKHG